MDYTQVIEAMRSHMRQLPRFQNGNGVVSVECPFCGDSSSSRHPHFYMKMINDSVYNMPLFSYQCKRASCNRKSKVINTYVAKMLHIEDPVILEYIKNLNKTLKNGKNYTSYTHIHSRLSSINVDLSDDLTVSKLDYIKDRIGYKDIYTDYNKFKIIPDLVKFYQANKNLPLNYDYKDCKNYLRNLHNKCIGFLSMDNTKINFRDITGTIATRYVMYSIYPERYNIPSAGTYVIPNKLTKLNKIKLIMAEGVFCTLRIFTDFYKSDNSVGIFASVNNSDGYNSMIRKLFSLGIIPEEVIIYSDSDVDISFYIKKVKPIIPGTKLTIHYNLKAKDYGDIKDPLQLSKRTLL